MFLLLFFIYISRMVMIVCMNMFVQLRGELIHNVFLLCRYLSELLAERLKISPFMHVLPNVYRLLNQGELHCYVFFSCTQIKACMIFRNGFFFHWIPFMATRTWNNSYCGKQHVYGVCSIDNYNWKLNQFNWALDDDICLKLQIYALNCRYLFTDCAAIHCALFKTIVKKSVQKWSAQ